MLMKLAAFHPGDTRAGEDILQPLADFTATSWLVSTTWHEGSVGRGGPRVCSQWLSSKTSPVWLLTANSSCLGAGDAEVGPSCLGCAMLKLSSSA